MATCHYNNNSTRYKCKFHQNLQDKVDVCGNCKMSIKPSTTGKSLNVQISRRQFMKPIFDMIKTLSTFVINLTVIVQS